MHLLDYVIRYSLICYERLDSRLTSSKLLSRLANDNILSDTNTSSFMTEMKETAYLLQHVTNSSVVVIDELCRSTSPNNAIGIAAAVCEELARTKVNKALLNKNIPCFFLSL